MDSQSGDTKKVEACCSSPAAICYWFAISLVSWGMLGLVKSLLASVESGRCSDDLIGYGNRLLFQLDQESDFSLWNNGTALLDCRCAASILEQAHYSYWERLRVADSAAGIGSRIPPGVAIYLALEIRQQSLVPQICERA